jgi:hypothetical protein
VLLLLLLRLLLLLLRLLLLLLLRFLPILLLLPLLLLLLLAALVAGRVLPMGAKSHRSQKPKSSRLSYHTNCRRFITKMWFYVNVWTPSSTRCPAKNCTT